MTSDPEGNGGPSGTISRAVLVLRALAEADGEVTIAGLADESGLPRPTVHRLLNLLRQEGMVEARPRGRGYAIGQEFFRIAALVVKRQDLVRLARPTMEVVAGETGESCMLGIYLPARRRMMIADDIASVHPLGYRITRLTPMSLVWGASGKAILAFLPEHEVAEIVASDGPSPVTGEQIPEPDVLRGELAAIRAQGYAYTQGQKIPDSRGIAAPIVGPDGHAIASLCLTIPEMRFDDGKREQLAETVKAHAAQVSRLVGHEPAAPR